MSNGDTLRIDGCQYASGIIYDNGGPWGDYSDLFNGCVIIEANLGATIHITGNYNTEPNYDILNIWDNDSLVRANVCGAGSMNVNCTSGRTVIRFTSNGGSSRSGFDLHFTITGGPSVSNRINSLSASGISATGATLQWSSGHSGPYHVLCDNPIDDAVTTTTTTFTLSGLNPATRHTATVYADGMSDNRCAKATVQFRTLCGTCRLPFREDFDDVTAGAMTPCWTRSMNFDDSYSLPRVYSYDDYNKVQLLSCGNNNTGSHFGMVTTPIIASGAEVWHVCFRMKTSHANTKVIVGFCDSTSDEQSSYGFIPLETLSPSTNGWLTYNKSYTVPSGGCRLAFRMEQSMQSGVGRIAYIDDLIIESCGVRQTQAIHPDVTSFELLWDTVGSPDVTIKVQPAWGSGEVAVYTHATSPMTVSGLTPNTRYEIVFYASCDGEPQIPTSIYANTISTSDFIDELCDLVTPWNATIGSYELAAGWSALCAGGDATTDYDGVFHLRNNCYLISPPLNQPGGKELMLEYLAANPATDRVVVGTMTYPDDISTFTPLDTLEAANIPSYSDTAIQLPSIISDNYIAFKGLCYGNSAVNIRSVSLNAGHVYGARITQVKSTQVTLAWNAPTTGTVYIEYYSTVSGPHYTDSVTNATQAIISGLLPEHLYHFNLYLPSTTPCPYVGEQSITTARRDYDLPYCEDFEEYLPNEAYGWTVHTSLYGCPSQSVEYVHSGTQSLKLSATSGNYSSTIALPNIEGIAGSVISFWATTLAPASAVIVGYYPVGNTQFQTIDTLPIASNVGWRHYYCFLPTNITGNLALRYELTGCDGIYYVWIDDLVLGSANYADYTFANLRCHSIDVVFHVAGTTDSLDVILASRSDTVRVTGVPDTIHVTGLTSGQNYTCFITPHGGCTVFAGGFYTMNCDDSGGGGGGGDDDDEGGGSGGGGGISSQRCNPMDDLLSYELPHGWVFSDSLLASLVNDAGGGYALQMLSPDTAERWSTITLPRYSYNALYLRARGLSQGVWLAANGDTVMLDTVWRSYAFPYSNSTTISVRGGSGCLIDDVGQSYCPRVLFTVAGNAVTCNIEGGHQYEYILHLTDTNGNERGLHITTNPFTIDNLQPSEEYNVWWEFLYMDLSCVPVFTIATEAIPLPYCINLEDNNNTLPAGWIATQRDGYDDVSIDGTTRLRFSAGTTSWNYLIMPQMESADYLQLSLYGLFSGQELQVGHLAVGTDTASFVADTIIVHNTMNVDGAYHLGLRNIGLHRIALRYKGCCLFIQRLGISRDPKIHFHVYSPTTLTLQAETDSSYRLAYNNSDYWPTATVRTISANPTTLPFGGGDLYVKQLGGVDNCNLPTLIRKPASTTMPYCDDAYYNDLNNTYTAFPSGSYYVSHTTINWRYCYQMMPGEQPTLFVMPYLTNTDVSNARFSFDCRVDNAGGAIEVGVMTDLLDTTSFVPVETLVFSTTGWHQEFVDLSSYSGSGRWIAFRAKSSLISGNFYFNKIRIDACFVPSTTTVHLEHYTQVVIEGNADAGNGPFWVEYGEYGIIPGQGTLVHFDSLPARLDLAPSSEYSIYIYCGSNRNGCSNHYHISTLDLPLFAPSCTNFESDAMNYMPQGWTAVSGPSVVTNITSHEGTRSLTIHGIAATPVIDVDTLGEVAVGFWMKATEMGAYLIVGSMTSASTASSFHPLKVLVPRQVDVWEYHIVSLADAPSNARYIAFRNASENSSHNLFIDELLITQCALFDMRIVNLENSSIELAWQRLGTPDATVTVSDNTIATTTQYDLSTQSSNTLTIPISPQHSYLITTASSCSTEGMPCSVPYTDTINLIVPADGFGCVDPSDINSPQAVFFSGSYSNPYSNIGPVDFGPQQAASRHTINYDTSARDPRTGGLLRTIPEGFSSSVRLGNWNTSSSSPEAEGVIYSFLVDTLDFSLLLMHYAAVLQDPMHAPEDQPRFRLELLDTNYNLIDPNCAAADFIANRNLGWNVAEDNVLWKDWTTVGVDLTAYHGQQVYLRLTTYDCNEGSHYGYAYFTLECMLKNITAENCGDVSNNIFTAPTGFNYRWYTTTDNSTLSTSQTLVAPTSQNTTYLCDLSFIGNPNCSFTLSAYGGSRFPLARFDTLVSYSNCRIQVQFVNHSTVSSDGVTPVSSGENAETAHWDFGNGLASDSYHGYTTYDQPGTYIVTLIAGISGGACQDTLVMPITVDFPLNVTIEGPQSLCYGDRDTLRLYNATTTDSLWQTVNGCPVLPLSPDNYHVGDNSFSMTVTNAYGCPDSASHKLRIDASYTRLDSLHLCTPQLPFSYADTVFLPGTIVADYHQYGETTMGCDSSFHLHLQTSPTDENTVFDTVEASICDNESYYFFGTSYSTAGTHMANHTDSQGHCDSLHSLLLDVRPTSITDTMADACDHFSWYGTPFYADTIVSRTTSNIYLCDSTIRLSLYIHPTYDLNDSIVVCHNQRYLYEGVDYGGPIAFDSPHLSRYDCDSLVHVTLYASSALFPAPPIVSLDNVEWYPYDTLLLGCDPQRLYLLDTSISTNRLWTLWNVADSTEQYTSSARDFSPTLDTTGIFGFQLISTSAEGCYDTVRNDSLLWIFPSPEANFFWSPSRLSIHNPEVQFYNNTIPDTCTYQWLFPHNPSGGSYDSSLAANPYYSWEINTDSGDYPVALIAYWLHQGPDTLTIVCTDTVTLPVTIVNTYLQFPNVVTPNGDGINDRWVIVNLLEMGEYPMNELWIYDRWGAPVFHVKNISKPSDFWNPDDTHSPDGTYYYRFLAKNSFGVVKRNGVIEVTR